MKGILQFLFLAILILIVFGCENQTGEKMKSEVNLIDKSTANEKENQNWRNPTITPFGKDLPTIIRGYFLVGNFNKMLQFMIWPNDLDSNEIRRIIQKSTWGYEIKVTNLKWQDDTSFVLTIRSTIQNTVGMEQYEGKIQNDTAKLIVIPNSTKLFAL
jgi:hypothetical protein